MLLRIGHWEWAVGIQMGSGHFNGQWNPIGQWAREIFSGRSLRCGLDNGGGAPCLYMSKGTLFAYIGE